MERVPHLCHQQWDTHSSTGLSPSFSTCYLPKVPWPPARGHPLGSPLWAHQGARRCQGASLGLWCHINWCTTGSPSPAHCHHSVPSSAGCRASVWLSARAAPQRPSAITKGANWERNQGNIPFVPPHQPASAHSQDHQRRAQSHGG